MPNIPNRSSSAARVAASTGSDCPHARSGPPTASPWRARPRPPRPASPAPRTRSAAACGRSAPAVPTPGRRPGRCPSFHLGGEPLATSLADSIASMRPAPISSARDATPITPSAPADPPTSSPICLSSAMSAALSVRSRNTTASTRGTPSSGTSSRSVRSETSRDSDEVPGVSMMVVSTSSAAGHSTSRSTTSSGSRLAKSNVSPDRGPARSARWTGGRRGDWPSPSASARAGTR